MTILQTTDYNIFNSITGNRPIDYGHIKRLRNSITKQNLLSINPILVNEAMEVIDGQHRLVVAQELQIPIYYIVDNNLNLDSISLINNAQLRWSYLSYINLYSSRGNEHYIKLREFVKKHEIPIGVVSKFLRVRHQSIKTGEFKYFTEEYEKLLVDTLRNVKVICGLIKDFSFDTRKHTVIKGERFNRALISFLLREDVDFDHFEKNFKLLMHTFSAKANGEAYYNFFVQIYNHNKRINRLES